MNLKLSKTFLKSYAKLQVRQKREVDEAIRLYLENRVNPSLRDHPLKGSLKTHRSFSAGWDLRVIYREFGGFVTIVLIDVGTHSQVY